MTCNDVEVRLGCGFLFCDPIGGNVRTYRDDRITWRPGDLPRGSAYRLSFTEHASGKPAWPFGTTPPPVDGHTSGWREGAFEGRVDVAEGRYKYTVELRAGDVEALPYDPIIIVKPR